MIWQSTTSTYISGEPRYTGAECIIPWHPPELLKIQGKSTSSNWLARCSNIFPHHDSELARILKGSRFILEGSWHNGSGSVLKYALALLGLASMAKLHLWMAWSSRSTQLNSMLKQRGPPNKSSKQNPLNYQKDRGKSKKWGGDAAFCSRVFLTS